MASAIESLRIIDEYLVAGNEPRFGRVAAAMRELIAQAVDDPVVRRMFAFEHILEMTLAPPQLVPNRIVAPELQVLMLQGIYEAASGGWWGQPEPAGITEWIGSPDSGRDYFIASLEGQARQVTPGVEIPQRPEVTIELLRIVRDLALPISWFAPMEERRVFARIEARAPMVDASVGLRTVLVGVLHQARGRVVGELAKLATAQVGAFPSYPTGDGTLTPTVRPPAKRWHRNGWAWAGVAASAFAGVYAASR